MTKVCTAVALSIGILFTESGAAQGQRTESLLQAFIDASQSESWVERKDVFYAFIDAGIGGGFRGRTQLIPTAVDAWTSSFPARGQVLRTTLVRRLDVETRTFKQMGFLPEEANDYWGDLTAAVAGLGDFAAIAPLVALIDRGNIVTKGLARIGGQAVPHVLARIDDPDPPVRQSVARTLSQMIDSAVTEPSIDLQSRVAIEAGLLKLSSDVDPFVRAATIRGLALLSTAGADAVLERLAAADPFFRLSGTGGMEDYPVRKAARDALQARRNGTNAPK